MFINILPSVRGALRTLVLGNIPESCVTTSTSGDVAAFTIGLVNSAWPDVPSKTKIMLTKYGKVQTVPSEARLFYEETLLWVDDERLTLKFYLHCMFQEIKHLDDFIAEVQSSALPKTPG